MGGCRLRPVHQPAGLLGTGRRPGSGRASALNIVLPEVYLDKVDTPTRIRAIHETMERYRSEVLTAA